jgi:hypothetical protein
MSVYRLGTGAHTYNLATWEAEIGRIKVLLLLVPELSSVYESFLNHTSEYEDFSLISNHLTMQDLVGPCGQVRRKN